MTTARKNIEQNVFAAFYKMSKLKSVNNKPLAFHSFKSSLWQLLETKDTLHSLITGKSSHLKQTNTNMLIY